VCRSTQSKFLCPTKSMFTSLFLLHMHLTILSCSELGKITLDKTFEEREALN
jgi:hypothetical protein